MYQIIYYQLFVLAKLPQEKWKTAETKKNLISS